MGWKGQSLLRCWWVKSGKAQEAESFQQKAWIRGKPFLGPSTYLSTCPSTQTSIHPFLQTSARKPRCGPDSLEAEFETKILGKAPMRMGRNKVRQAEEGTSKVMPDPGEAPKCGLYQLSA